MFPYVFLVCLRTSDGRLFDIWSLDGWVNEWVDDLRTGSTWMGWLASGWLEFRNIGYRLGIPICLEFGIVGLYGNGQRYKSYTLVDY